MAVNVKDRTGRQAEHERSAHERGYRDWKKNGLTNREPYFAFTWLLESYRRGYQKGKKEDRR